MSNDLPEKNNEMLSKLNGTDDNDKISSNLVDNKDLSLSSSESLKWKLEFYKNSKPFWVNPVTKEAAWATPPQEECDPGSWKRYNDFLETEKLKAEATMRSRTRNQANVVPLEDIQGSKEAREALLSISNPLTKALLLKYLLNLGWTSQYVDEEVIENSTSRSFSQLPDVIDQNWNDFEQYGEVAIKKTKEFFNKQNQSQKEKDNENKISSTTTENEVSSNENDTKTPKFPILNEMDDFFLKCSVGILGSKTVESIHNQNNGIKPETKEEKEKRRIEKISQSIKDANEIFLQSSIDGDNDNSINIPDATSGTTLYSLTRPKRSNQSRVLLTVDGFQILKENNYTLEEGITTISGAAENERKNAPEKPVAVRSAYNFFTADVTTKSKGKNKIKNDGRSLQKIVGEAWRNLPENEKSRFVKLAKDDQERFQKEMNDYSKAMEEYKKSKEKPVISIERSLSDPASYISRSSSATPSIPRSATSSSISSTNIPKQKGAPKIGIDNIVDAAILAMGARSSVTLSIIIKWIEQSPLGNQMKDRLRAPYDTSKVEKAIRKGIGIGQYFNRYVDKNIEHIKMSHRAIKEIALSNTLEESRKSTRIKRPRRANNGSDDDEDDEDDDYNENDDNQESGITRAENNEIIKRCIVDDAKYRWAFFIRHKEALLPFIDDDIAEKLNKAEKFLQEGGYSELLEKGIDSDPKKMAEIVSSLRKTNDDNDLPHSSENSSDGENKISKSKRTRTKSNNDKILLPQPSRIQNGNMRKYQLESLTWLVNMFDNGADAILADEMGLGKTLQTIAFLAHLRFERNIKGPYLVIVPLSVLTSWCNEFRRWCPDMKVVKMHSSAKEERDRLKREILNQLDSFDVIVTTYEMIVSVNMKAIISSKVWWRLVVIDEGHKIKNDETELSQAVRSIHSQHRLLLTGTPLQNNLHELWALLNFLFPELFQSSEKFDSCFDLSRQLIDRSMLEKAHYLLRPFVLRRTKFEVENSLPPKEEIEIKIPLSKMQSFWYKRLLLKDNDLLARVEASLLGSSSSADQQQTSESEINDWKKMQSLMMQLRKCCDHPFLFPDAEPEFDGSTSEDLVEASGKLKILDRLLVHLQRNGHRVVIFSQFTSMLDILQDFCTLRDYKFSRLDGSINRVQRAIDIMQYNQEDSQHFIYLMSTRAGGLGINLATADTVILYDSDWNPQVDLQAMDRVHRIGQTKPVHVYRLICAGTVEERIVQRAKKKLFLDKMVNRGSTMQAEMLETLSKVEMLKMLKFGATSVIESNSTTTDEYDTLLGFSDENLLSIIDRKKKKKDVTKGAEQNALEFDDMMPALSMNELNGVDIRQQAESMEQEGNKNQTVSTPSTDKNKEVIELSEQSENQINDDEKSKQTMKSIADEWKALNPKSENEATKSSSRVRTSRFVEIDGYTILKSNNYSLEQGERSVFDQELAKVKKLTVHEVNKELGRGRQVAGRDYQNESQCLVCWDGGDILLCDQCPASYHLNCLKPNQKPKKNSVSSWGCPHHSCKVCGRKAAAAGGLLFRCTECPNAFCEDHLPLEGTKLLENGRCPRFEILGMRKPAQAYFIQCCKNCSDFAVSREKNGVDVAILESQNKKQKIN